MGRVDYRAVARDLHDTLERRREPMYGLQYEEALEMAYENIQAEAAQAITGRERP